MGFDVGTGDDMDRPDLLPQWIDHGRHFDPAIRPSPPLLLDQRVAGPPRRLGPRAMQNGAPAQDLARQRSGDNRRRQERKGVMAMEHITGRYRVPLLSLTAETEVEVAHRLESNAEALAEVSAGFPENCLQITSGGVSVRNAPRALSVVGAGEGIRTLDRSCGSLSGGWLAPIPGHQLIELAGRMLGYMAGDVASQV